MLSALLLLLAGPTTTPPPATDPATAVVDTADADRFARLFRATNGRPTAEQLQRDYLDRGSYGVHVFMDGRIDSASALAAYIAAHQADYRTAIDRCLPVARAATAELRTIYAGLHRLYPDRPLPHLYVVFGRGNSGGTAGPGAQVLGLEVLCAISPDAAALRTTLRRFFAHETVHTWQRDHEGGAMPLLDAILVEGAADYVAMLATGAVPDPERAAWAAPREAELWRQLDADLAATQGAGARTPAGRAAMRRWVGNYSNAPAGWPYELGYWIGMRIWERYVAAQPDRAAALRTVLDWRDAGAVLAQGRYPG